MSAQLLKVLLGLLLRFLTEGRKLFLGAPDLPSPRVDIEWGSVNYDKQAKELRVSQLEPPIWIATVSPSNSMEPLIDAGHILIFSSNSIYLNKVKVGSVIVVRDEETERRAIHSISKIGEDKQGWYCKTKGLNNALQDSFKIRRDEIKWVALAIFWADLPQDIWWTYTKI